MAFYWILLILGHLANFFRSLIKHQGWDPLMCFKKPWDLVKITLALFLYSISRPYYVYIWMFQFSCIRVGKCSWCLHQYSPYPFWCREKVLCSLAFIWKTWSLHFVLFKYYSKWYMKDVKMGNNVYLLQHLMIIEFYVMFSCS